MLAGDAPMIGAELLSPRIRQCAPADDEPSTIDTGSLPAASRRSSAG